LGGNLPSGHFARSDMYICSMNFLTECPTCGTPSLIPYAQIAAQMHPTRKKYQFDRCTSCQLIMLNPRPNMDEMYHYYGSHYLPYRGADAWGKYRRLVDFDQQLLDKRRKSILSKFGQLNNTSTLLDVGCGKPTFLHSVQSSTGARCIGVDFSDHGWSDQPDNFTNLNLIVSAPHQFSPNQKLDFITMWHFLEHDYTPAQTLRHMASLSKPETVLIVEVPNFESASRRKYGNQWAGWHTPRHTFLYSPHNLRLLLQNSGWEVKDLKLSGTLSNVLLYWMSEMEKKQIDWSGSMDQYFWGLMKEQGKIFIKTLLNTSASHGIMMAVASPSGK